MASGTPRNLRRTARMRVTGRGWGTLALGVLALALGYALGRRELLVIAAAALLLVLVGLFVARLQRPRLEVVRVFSPPVAAAGDVVQVRMRVRNAGPGASPELVWNDAIPWPEEDAAPRPLAPIPAGGPEARVRVVGYELHPPRRGVYAIGPLVAENLDPFGMAASIAALGAQDRLVVIPAVAELPAAGPALADGEGAAQLVQRRVTGNDDDLTTREYRMGDALRRVHWRASARHGELMVRQEEHRSHPDARLLIDTRLAGYPDARPDSGGTWEAASDSEAFEWVVRMAASVAMHLDASGFRVAVEETGPAQLEQLGQRWEGGRRAEGFLTGMAGVGLVDPRGSAVAAPRDAVGPVFAMVGDPEDATVDALLHRRSPGDPAIVFAVEARPGVLDRFEEAGWTCVPVASDTSLVDAWRAASAWPAVTVPGRGPAHAGR